MTLKLAAAWCIHAAFRAGRAMPAALILILVMLVSAHAQEAATTGTSIVLGETLKGIASVFFAIATGAVGILARAGSVYLKAKTGRLAADIISSTVSTAAESAIANVKTWVEGKIDRVPTIDVKSKAVADVVAYTQAQAAESLKRAGVTGDELQRRVEAEINKRLQPYLAEQTGGAAAPAAATSSPSAP